MKGRSLNLIGFAFSAVLSVSLWLGAVAAFTLPATATAAIDVYEFESQQKEKEFHELTATLRCPKCQNNSIADSNAELAKDMRQKTYEMLSEGKSKQDVIDYMVARYGNFVTYNPPIMASTLILWAGPLLFIVIGFTVLVLRSRKNSVSKPAKGQLFDEKEQARLQALMAEMGQDMASDTEAASGNSNAAGGKVKK